MATLALRFCGKRYPSNFSRSHAADWGPGEGRNASRGLWLDDEFTGLKTLTLRRLFRGHSLVCSLTRPAGLGRGTPRRLAPTAGGHPATHLFRLSLSEPLLRDHARMRLQWPAEDKGQRVVRLISRANLLLKRAKADVQAAAARAADLLMAMRSTS